MAAKSETRVDYYFEAWDQVRGVIEEGHDFKAMMLFGNGGRLERRNGEKVDSFIVTAFSEDDRKRWMGKLGIMLEPLGEIYDVEIRNGMMYLGWWLVKKDMG